MSVKRKKVKGLDLEYYQQRLADWHEANGSTWDVAPFALRQLEKRLVVVEFETPPHGFRTLEAGIYRGVVVHGDRFTVREGAGNRQVYVLLDNDRLLTIPEKWLVFLEGGPRGIYWPLGVFMGKTSIMGRVAHGISSGKAFRGR